MSTSVEGRCALQRAVPPPLQVGRRREKHPSRSAGTDIGAEPVGSSPAEVRRIVSEHIDKVRPLVAYLKLVVQEVSRRVAA